MNMMIHNDDFLRTETVGGYEIGVKIAEDPELENPRQWDNLSKMFCGHKRYILGDNFPDDFRPIEECSNWDQVEDYIRRWYGNDLAWIHPLYLYDHGGITISMSPFSCPWDSGQIGYVFLLKSQIRNMFGVRRIGRRILKKAINAAKNEVDLYDEYIRGNVYDIYVKKEGKWEFVTSYLGDWEKLVDSGEILECIQ